MGIANLIEKLASAAGQCTPAPGTSVTRPNQPITTYPATYPIASASPACALEENRIGLRASSQLYTCAGAHTHGGAYIRTDEKLADLPSSCATTKMVTTSDGVGRPESSRDLTRSILPPPDVIVLKHCRCTDCRNFSQVGADYFCSEYIGGTSVVWATGERECDPPPEAWHYCSHYHGPQISKDVWLWPRRSHHVGAGSTIAPEAEQLGDEEVLI